MNQTTKATFVLIHGAWHGGWCWKKLTPLLRAAGHEVYTPTLTGLADRAHLLSPQIGLNTHIADISALLEYEDLHNVILVGHSDGGMVITGVAEVAAQRLAHLVFLDAFVPQDGQSLFDTIPDRGAAMKTIAPRRRHPRSRRHRHFGLHRTVVSNKIVWRHQTLTLHPLRFTRD
jgi:pimeloyl-ACP methyl ester carboxylesterase